MADEGSARPALHRVGAHSLVPRLHGLGARVAAMTRAKQCARCGKRLPVSKPRIFSHFTHFYYCAEIDACSKRAAKARPFLP